MAKKKKKEVETGRILGRLNDDGSITPFIQKQQEEDIAPVRNDNKWFKSGIDTSGYDIQNPLDAINRFNASVLMTGVDIIGQVGLGVTKPIEGVGDFAQNRVADVLDFFGGDKTAEKIRKSAAKEWGVNRELEQSLARDNDRGIDDMSFLGTKGKSIPQGVGSVLLAMGSGGLGGAIGGTNAAASVASLGIMGVGSAGNAEQEALEQGATRGEARLYGILSGASETLSEMMFGGLSKGSQVLGIGTGMLDSADDALINSLTKKINNRLVRTFTQAGLKATSEGIEEVVSGLGSAWAKKLTYMKEEDIKKLIEDENLLDSFLSGTLSAAVSQAPNVAQNITTRQDGKLRLQSNNEIRDFITNLNEQEQQVVEREIENRLGQEEKATKKRRIEIEKQVIEDLDRGYINANTIRDVLGDNYNAERDVRLNESFNEETRRTQAYENDLSKYDEKQRKVIQTAIDSGLLNNSNKTHDFVDLIAKISADKGVDFDFTNNDRINESGFGIKGKTVNGYVKDGTINLNLESNQALNKTVGHEITHVLEGTDLYNSLQDSLKSFIGEREWNNRISELEKTYKNVKGANIENELTSDLVGEYVFNDEKFVKSLSTRNPNLFQKIYDEIKYMVKIATAGSKEARDLEKVKRAFEKAYRETSKTQEGTQYSMSEKVDNTQDVNNYIKEKGFTFKENGNLEVKDLTDKQIKDLVKLYKTTGYEDVSSEYLTERLKSGQMPIQREVADRFIEKELGHKPQYDTTKIFEDAEGNKLTPEQVEFYKDSDVRDIRGRLIPVYHRTNADFTIFDEKAGTQHGKKYGKGFYFSITPENYGNNTMKVYLNAKEGEFKYVPKMGYYIVQEANQIKNVDNTNPTSNPDIRYSLSSTGEMVDNATGKKVELDASDTGTTGTLMAIHNLGESKLNGILDLDGIPVPSIAITNPEIVNHKQFGEGSLIFSKNTIDPAIRENEVYDRDVWSPTFPTIEYDVNVKDLNKVRNIVGGYGNEYLSGANSKLNNIEEIINRNGYEGLKEDLKDNKDFKYVYYKTLNPDFKIFTKTDTDDVSTRYSNEFLQEFINEYGKEIPNWGSIEDNQRKEIVEKFKEKWIPVLEQKRDSIIEEENKKENPRMFIIGMANSTVESNLEWLNSLGGQDKLIENLNEIQRTGGTKEVNDYQKTNDFINDNINQEDYEKWIDDNFKSIVGKKGIYNGKEYLTSQGNRRTFNQLHEDYNLKNLVKEITKQSTVAGESGFGAGQNFGTLQAKMSNKFNSIEDIKNAENRIQYDENSKELIDNYSNEIYDYMNQLREYSYYKDNSYFYGDNAGYALNDFADYKTQNVDNLKKALEKNGINSKEVPTELLNNIVDSINELKNIPTDYFEAKPQRAVELNEIGMAVIPNNWSEETKQRLTDKGIPYTEYDPTVEGDRQRVINQFDDLKFSLSQDNIAPTSGWNVRSEDVRLQSAFKDAIAPIQEQVQQLTDSINEMKQNIAPYRALTEQEGQELAEQFANEEIRETAPIRNNLTEEENRRMDMLELLERNNMLNEEQREEMTQLESKINPVYEDEEISTVETLSDIRDIDEVGSQKVKAYQYEHPEVKPFFQEEARGMLSDLRNSQKGERIITEGQQRGQGTYYDVIANKRFTSPEIAELLDSKWGYTYSDIEKGLNAIIEDHGAENIAIAKRIEFTLDDNLRNGYTDWQTGMEIPPNQDYLNMLAEQEWQNYFDDINNQYPLDVNQVQYALEQERQQEEQYRIEKTLEEMTADDINLEPFLSGLQGASERQAERQQLRNELNEKREVKVPKNPSLNKAKNRGLGLLVNEFAEIDDYAKRTGNKDIKFKADTYNNYQAIAQSNIETAQTDINGKRIGRSGNSIFEEAKKYGLEETFDEYLKQWANVDRAKQGKGVANYSAKESYKIVKEMETKYPVLKRLGNDMWQYYRNARHNLRDAGVINQDVSDMLGRMYPHYTPYISENIENYFTDEGKLKPKATIKRAKGGAAIGSLLSTEEAMQRYTKSEFNTIFGNDLFKEIINTSNDIVQLGGDDRGMQFVNADNLYADKDGYYLTAYENGEPITAKISEDMYRTLTRESRNRISDIENTFSAVTKPLQGLSKLRRNILTSWSPTFFVKNALKDIQEGVFNSKYTKDFIKNYPSAFKELASNTELAQQFKSLYGSGLTMGQYDIDSTNYTPSGKNKTFLQNVKNLIPSINEIVELAPRYAEFKASIDHGASLQEAMYNAREVTTNFSRGGTLAKALNRNGFTFLNSSIQGFDKFIRNFSGENGAKGIVNSLAKAAIFGIAPAVFNELAFGSGDDKDEEYEALPDYIKDNYYIIKVGNGNFIRIPKGRVLSVFGSAARRTIEAMEGEENAFEGFLNNAWTQVGFNNPDENNIFAPLIQAYGTENGTNWYDKNQPIVPTRLQDKPKAEQYDAGTDAFSIWLGDKLGISPYKLNYVLDQYSGGIGDIFLPMITEEANSDGSIIAPIKDQFTADSTTDNKYVSDFYSKNDELTVNANSSKATDEDILKQKYMSTVSFDMGQLYKERREVQADKTLSKQEKYQKAQAIKDEINRMAKEALDNYENVNITGDYANINGMEYQKTDDGWKKVNSNNADTMNSLGLSDREKNNYTKTKQNISSIKEKYKDTDDYNGKKSEIIGEIINTNLDDNSKLSLYQDTYRDKLADSIDDLGINADTYLEYKAQDFSADKDKNGKSISGSKKRKVFDYINSLDIPYQQKLILAKSEYNSFNDNNAEIIEYIENTGMDYDERIELYKALGFKIDGDTIRW